MKQCCLCGLEKELAEYHRAAASHDGHERRCKKCRKQQAAEDYRENWFHWTVKLKKSYCTKNSIPFDLTPEYLESIWTVSCPVFGKPFEMFDKTSSFCPSLDRVDPAKGYVRGNVRYISARANRIKYDATAEELLQVVKYLEGATTIPQGRTQRAIGGGSAEPLEKG